MATWVENWGTLVPLSLAFLVLPGLDELHLEIKSLLGRSKVTPSAKQGPPPLAYVINPLMLVLGSSDCLSSLEGREGRLAAKPNAWNNRKSHAGRREECVHVCVFDFVCVSLGGWW